MSRLLSILWKAALVFALAKCLADLLHDGQPGLAIAAVALPVGIAIVVFTRRSGRSATALPAMIEGPAGSVFGRLPEPDRVRIAALVASGNSIAAIMALRKSSGLDLRAAKLVVDGLATIDRVVA